MCSLITSASAMPLLEHNISAHNIYPSQPPQTEVLDWDEPLLVLWGFSQGFDVIMYCNSTSSENLAKVYRMADVTYNTESFPSLIRTVSV